MDVIGVDVGGTKIAAGTVSDGKLIDAIEIPVHAKASPRDIFSQICLVIDALNTSRVKTICVGFPGVVHPKTGVVSVTTNIPKFKHVPLRKWLTQKYRNKKILVQNDAKCFALGQLSSMKNEKHIVGLIIGTGVGAGIIMNRKIITGKDGAIGEVGGWISSTGKSYEELLGGHDFTKQFHASGAELFDKASHGSKNARKMFASYGAHLAELIAVITVTYAPQRIVLGGSVSKASKYFLSSTQKELSRLKVSAKVRLPKIEVASQKYAGVIGAASLAGKATSRGKK